MNELLASSTTPIGMLIAFGGGSLVTNAVVELFIVNPLNDIIFPEFNLGEP